PPPAPPVSPSPSPAASAGATAPASPSFPAAVPSPSASRSVSPPILSSPTTLPGPATTPIATPTPMQTPASGGSAAAARDKQREQKWSFESLLAAGREVNHLLETVHLGAEVSVLLITGAACAVHVANPELLRCIQKALRPEEAGAIAAGGASEAAQAATAVLKAKNAEAAAARENADLAASLSRA